MNQNDWWDNTPTASAPIPQSQPEQPADTSGSSSSSGSSSGGYTPDYTSLIQNDPAYLAAVAANNAAQSAAQAQRRASLRRAYIMYGGDLPGGFKDKFGDLDKATLAAAGGNENSIIAQLARAYAQNTEQFHRQLAARGALQSGDLNYGADQLQRGNEQQRYDAGNQFLDQANQFYGQYQDVLNQDADRLVAAIQGAEGNVYNNPAYRPSTPSDPSSASSSTSSGLPGYDPSKWLGGAASRSVVYPGDGAAGYATYHPAASAMAGHPVYQDGSGNLFDHRGAALGLS